jgi:hypothetical protein
MPIPPKIAPRVKRKIDSVPLWRARAMLKRQGLFAAIDAQIEAEKDTKPGIWEAWNHGYVIGRNSKLLKRLNLAANVEDKLFADAAKAD